MMFVALRRLSVMMFVDLQYWICSNYDVFAYRVCRSIENSLFSVSFSVLNAGGTEK